ncbi:MAG: hypothetical protein PHN71_03005 [Candidatus Cloacimonetes bacterium]|nr:hypothetical protein [Candidatus Cloacimonadota bacterium]MDD2210274.1 hypothetical protein [Candidatus Cloacimonadota bacterium]MDD4232092.1 hypothetical protein [Candidatus Cloacimonadota bacterium]MDD4686733.1 hypothetical protein [Candidatus Cloacimonadota bacterium]
MKICPIDSSSIENLVQYELQLHPQSEPVDLFKLLYQALYGPFHIIKDLKQLSLGISSELWKMQHSYLPHFQNIGPCYTRLSLSLINVNNRKHSQDTINCLTRWIISSCVLYQDVQQDFYERWKLYRPYLVAALPSNIENWNYADDLAEKGILPSHSALFHQYYHPHYRLVDLSLDKYKQEFMELIDETD